MKIKLIILSLVTILSSCHEVVTIVEVQNIKVDTTYTYKIEVIEDNKKYYKIITRNSKFKKGEKINVLL